MSALHVVGAGGHAKVVVALAQALGLEIAGLHDDHAGAASILGCPVLGRVSDLPDSPSTLAVLAIGNNAVRRELAGRFSHLRWATLIHPAAWVHGSAVLGAGSVVMAGAVVQPDARLGGHVIVNTGASVDHDCQLGDFVHVAPGCTLAGNVRLEDGVFLGVGARVIPGCSVGAWSVVGAGGVVVRDLPGGVTAFGVPARVRHP
jgi:sugar O-acyltransferase (sialic acid O-acetyltransferase NeuD family)